MSSPSFIIHSRQPTVATQDLVAATLAIKRKGIGYLTDAIYWLASFTEDVVKALDADPLVTREEITELFVFPFDDDSRHIFLINYGLALPLNIVTDFPRIVNALRLTFPSMPDEAHNTLPFYCEPDIVDPSTAHYILLEISRIYALHVPHDGTRDQKWFHMFFISIFHTFSQYHRSLLGPRLPTFIANEAPRMWPSDTTIDPSMSYTNSEDILRYAEGRASEWRMRLQMANDMRSKVARDAKRCRDMRLAENGIFWTRVGQVASEIQMNIPAPTDDDVAAIYPKIALQQELTNAKVTYIHQNEQGVTETNPFLVHSPLPTSSPSLVDVTEGLQLAQREYTRSLDHSYSPPHIGPGNPYRSHSNTTANHATTLGDENEPIIITDDD